jgi:TonB-dependent receptor
MALLAAAAASPAARAAETEGVPAAQQDASTTPPSDSKADSTVVKKDDEAAAPELQFVTVTGVRESQIRSIELKRLAPNIQDSISAESIGTLPDVTLTDALQRITGVQIDRDAGVGTQVNIRGLPQVGTMLNGEVFVTPNQIDSQQPDFTTIPPTLFNQIDVIKSSTADLTEGGITGALNLHTFRPWDLPSGFTYSYQADAERGSTTKKTGPEAAGLISYNADGRWGLQISGDYSDTTRENSWTGLDQYGVIFHGENGYSAAAYNGFLGAWNGAAIPSKIVQNPDGSVDVNGDGKSNGVFMGSQDIALYDLQTQRKRKAINASFQADLSHGLTMTSDYFYSHQDQWDRAFGIQFNSTNWQGATYVPLNSRDTGATALSQYNTPPQDPNWAGSHIFTNSIYEKWPGDTESFSQVQRRGATSQNINLQFDFNNGGPFKASARGVRATAYQHYIETDTNISDSDGCLWADPSTSLPCGTFVYPAELGGNRVFNANGIPQNTIPITANLTGRNLTVSMPSSLSSALANPNAWTMKTLESTDDYDQQSATTALRLDGSYEFNDRFNLHFGVRNSLRSADNDGFTLVTPVYGGIGAVRRLGCDPQRQCDRYHAQHLVHGGQLAGLVPRRPPVIAAHREHPGAAVQRLAAVQQSARLGDQLLGDRSTCHGQPGGVLEVALSGHHPPGSSGNHLERFPEGNLRLPAGEFQGRRDRRHAVERKPRRARDPHQSGCHPVGGRCPGPIRHRTCLGRHSGHPAQLHRRAAGGQLRAERDRPADDAPVVLQEHDAP